jgi:hypothetical protein
MQAIKQKLKRKSEDFRRGKKPLFYYARRGQKASSIFILLYKNYARKRKISRFYIKAIYIIV